MDILSWVGWLLATLASWAWALVWLLLGGWVSTLIQIVLIIFLVFAFKYGWRRAPLEMGLRVRPVGGWLWRWLTAREPPRGSAYDPDRALPDVRVVRVKAPGDVNLSSLLNVLMLAGLGLLRLL